MSYSLTKSKNNKKKKSQSLKNKKKINNQLNNKYNLNMVRGILIVLWVENLKNLANKQIKKFIVYKIN